MKQNILQVSLGSMGKRRLRCLRQLGYTNLYAFDINEDRCKEVETLYNIKCYRNINDCFDKIYDYMIISTPPQYHDIYIEIALEKKIKFFVEASVLNKNHDKFSKIAFQNNIINFPSCTFYFHPAIQIIKTIINDNTLGKLCNITYHSGQNLHDWHPYESIKNFYVSIKEVGGCREIVPFELLWITKIFGFPFTVYGEVKKVMDFGDEIDIDDVYCIILDYNEFVFNIVIDIISRPAIRKLHINSNKGQLKWNWKNKYVTIYNNTVENKINFDMAPAATGYDKNITEDMYIKELQHFINITEKEQSINSLHYDNTALKLLYTIEDSSIKKTKLNFINIGILINIKLGSTRLFNKHLLYINDKRAIDWLLIRLKKIISTLNQNITIVIASSDLPNNKELYQVAKDNDVEVFFGSDSNIPLRHKQCSDYYGFTHIIPIDGDDIFISELAINSLINEINNNNYCIAKTHGLPLGLNIIYYKTQYLNKVIKDHIHDKITVGWHKIFNNITNIKIADYNNTELRFTLDYIEDLHFFKSIIDIINIDFTIISTYDVIKLVIDKKLYEYNSKLTPIYWENFNKEKNNE